MKLAGGPTQDEVMAISLQKMDIRRGNIVADIGCGTGKVAIAMSERAGMVYAVDRRAEAIQASHEQISARGVTNIELLHQDGVSFLKDCEVLDRAFLGGTKQLGDMLELLSEKVRGRIVVNAVLLSSLHECVERMTDLGMFKEAVQVQIARSYPLGGSVMFRPIDPVFIIVGEVV
jgi:cobalt-precorrin-6B (C15)-methyltransferase